MKLLQINYNNQRVVVELVMCWNSCKGVSYVLGSVQRVSHKLEVCTSKEKKSTTRSSPTGHWSKGSTVDWYFGIGQGSC